ncbi:MAG: ATP-binding protein [Mariprofundales bacterium]
MHCAEFSDIHLQIRRACHDLNAPLRAVHGFAEILQQREAAHLSQRGQLYLQRMVGATEQMEKVVDGLHQYAKLNTHLLQLETLSIPLLTKKLLTACYPAAIASSALQWKADTPLQWVSDPKLLQTIMRALIDNGLLFTTDNQTAEVSLSWQGDAKQLQLSVSDHGIGIKSEHQQQIFTLFERLHNREQYPGVGTGLALVLKATKILHGSIAIHSLLDVGTTVIITLPLLETPHR